MERISIVDAKRDLSRVVNKVAFGHEPIILTSRGRPKAVLVGHEDFIRLTGGSPENIIRLGGRWEGTPEVSYQDLRSIRARVWSKLAKR